MERRLYIVSGQVQGVGFRPFVYRLALACGLSGTVSNTPQGVRIEAQGSADALALFERRLKTDAPPLARIASLTASALPVAADEGAFVIAVSQGDAGRGHCVLVSPDMAVCDACLADMLDPSNRRYGYAFTNCTDCGPRYSITRSIPYDRPCTSMACFALCDECRREYHDARNRRFHAQPNACPVCGPELWLEYGPRCEGRESVHGGLAVPALLDELRRGRLAAIKGLGGFHLACDALNVAAIRELRRRKNRPHKALAVMAADLDSARSLAEIGPEAEAALLSPRRPIVICPRRPGALPAALAPDSGGIGLLLPYTPLHHLLFHPEASGGRADQALRALVMTSGNAGGEPLCLGNREARARLGDIADVFLFHNRDILVRVDDSVLFADGSGPGADGSAGGGGPPVMLARRARGFVPEALPLFPESSPVDSVFAAGANLKHTFCLTRGREAFVSQHIGDLSRPGCLDFFEESLRHLLALLKLEPQLVVRDLHPDYVSGRVAEAFARERGLPLFTLQHHFAHMHAVLAEHGHVGAALGLALDGSGLGEDGTLWGGELLLVHPEAGIQRRLGRLRPFPLPGGEAAIREPWRTAEALWRQAELADSAPRPWLRGEADARGAGRAALMPRLDEMLRRGVNCPLTSSCGRLFDAVAALCGLCGAISYEGQAAVLLEAAQDWTESGAYALPFTAGPLLEADGAALFRAAAADRLAGVPVGRVARRFHRGLAEGLADWARAGADQCGVALVALGGGVFNNRTLVAELPSALRARGLTPLLPLAFPPGDAAVSLGQAAWGRLRALPSRRADC
ncbi:MAG: carbamoyltransferase HypF [Desulfovibrionaceae bacterium]|nr:carbamoyltransferase HypF [Desulfovibrionaceae bacterium]